MGLVQSKKDGITKKFELTIDLKAEIKKDLLELTNWSFKEIKQSYDIYCRKNQCPFIDFFNFNKIMPFSKEVNKTIFDSFTNNEKYLNIYELLCVLILMAHNNYRKKLQLLFIMFDWMHQEKLTNRQIIMMFQSMVNGFCRVTNQTRPKYQYLNRYTIQRFIRVNTLQAMIKIINYRRMIQEIEGNSDAFDLFKRFDQEAYGFFTQDSYLFRVSQYKKYGREDAQKIHRILKKVNLNKNYEDVELVDENRRFRLQNRKMTCIKHLLQEKEEKFKHSIGDLKTRANSLAMTSSALPSVKNRQSLTNLIPQLKINSSSTLLKTPSHSSRHFNHKKVLFLNGKIQNKEDIFETIKYFKGLSGNKPQIKIKQFFHSFQKKAFIKKQIGSLFKHFDLKKKGQISFQNFLRAYYHNITQKDIQLVKEWYNQFKTLHEADHFDIGEQGKKKQKKAQMELPRATLQRIDEIFNSIDRQKKGYLSIQDLKKAYNTGFTIKEVEDMMKQFGKNNKLYKEQFIRMTLPQDWTIEGTDFMGV